MKRMANYRYQLSGGRTIGVSAFGNPLSRDVIIFCHPAPGVGSFDPDPTVSSGLDARFIGIDRPGYGASDPLGETEWPSIAVMADDIAEFLRSEEDISEDLSLATHRSVGVVGWSAGGRVALALAARHPELVSRVVVTGTPGPHEDVPWIPSEYVAQLEVYGHMGPAEARQQLAAQLEQTAPSSDPEAPAPLEMVGVSDADDAVLEKPGLSRRLGDMLRRAFTQGGVGVATDLISYTLRPWGFDVSEVAAPTLLLYGQDDPLGPDHAAWYAERLQHGTIELVPHVGHLALVPEWGRIADFVKGEH